MSGPPLSPAPAAPQPPPRVAGTDQPARLEDAHFEAPVCRNCAAPLHTAHCSACGQKQARRFAWRDLRRETWEHWRLFELTTASMLWQLVRSRGSVAREYVMATRKRHMHPLKLLVLMVALLVLALNRNRFFAYFSKHDGHGARADHHRFNRRGFPPLSWWASRMSPASPLCG